MLTTLAGFALCLACQAPQTNPKPAAEIQSLDHLPPALRIEAARLNSPSVSPLFAALGERKGDASAVGLTKEQLELILEMDATTRKTLRHWLVRSRENGLPPLKAEDFEHAKAFVVGHMEAILLECVLTPPQAEKWRRLAGKPIIPPREGRYSMIPEVFPPDEPYAETRRGYLEEIIRLAVNQDWRHFQGVVCSDLFRLILDSFYTEKWGTLTGLTAKQIDLGKKLNEIACDSQRQWLMRGTHGMTMTRQLPPEQWEMTPTPAMVSRVRESGQRLRASVVSHAEEILLDAVLEPSQRTELKRRLWIMRGARALLDPELAAMLQLAKWQRQSIGLALEGRAVFWRKAHDIFNTDCFRVHGAKAKGALDQAEADKQLAGAQRSFDQRLANFDAAIWDVLSTAQSRTLAKILRKPIPKKEDEKTKKKSSRAG